MRLKDRIKGGVVWRWVVSTNNSLSNSIFSRREWCIEISKKDQRVSYSKVANRLVQFRPNFITLMKKFWHLCSGIPYVLIDI